MPLRTVTLAELRALARRLSDMENTDFISDVELDYYLNLGVNELYDLFAEAHGQEFFLKTFPIATSENVACYDLPDDFHVLKGVDWRRSPYPSNISDDGHEYWVMPYKLDDVCVIKPYMFFDRHRGSSANRGNLSEGPRFRLFTEQRIVRTPIPRCLCGNVAGVVFNANTELFGVIGWVVSNVDGVAHVTITMANEDAPGWAVDGCVFLSYAPSGDPTTRLGRVVSTSVGSGEFFQITVNTFQPFASHGFGDPALRAFQKPCALCGDYELTFDGYVDGAHIFYGSGTGLWPGEILVGDTVTGLGVVTSIFTESGAIHLVIEGPLDPGFVADYSYTLNICGTAPGGFDETCEYVHRIRFQPVRAAHALVWYMPEHPRLTGDDCGLVGFHGYEEYPAIFAAIRMLRKEESDFSGVLVDLDNMKARIRNMASNRDMGHPSVAQDFTDWTGE